MFKLDQAISEWRRKMSAGGIKTPAILDELESHLREDVEREIKSGCADAKAFEAAVQRIGQSSLLRAEFAKVNRFKWSRSAQVVGIALCVLGGIVALWVTPFFLTIREMTIGQRLLGLAAVAVVMFSIVSWRFSHRYLPVIYNRWLRTAVGLACGMAGMVWLYAFGGLLLYVVPRAFNSETSPQNTFAAFNIGLSFIWAIAFAAVLGGIAYGLEEAARRRMKENAYV